MRAVLLTVALLLTVAACGNAGEQEFPPQESGVAEESSAPDLAAEPQPEQPGQAAVDSRSEQAERAPAAEAANEQWQEQAEESGAEAEGLRIKLSFGGNEAIVTLYDTPPGRDLLSRLPLTLEFQDYVGTEKIAYLAEPLTSESGSNAPTTGDFAYYAPWGNLAIFYNEIPSAGGGLLILGSIESGKEQLAGITEQFTMTMELEN